MPTVLKDIMANPTGSRSILPGDQPVPQPKTIRDLLGYKDPKTWQKVLGIIGDGLQVAGGGRASYMPTLNAERQRMQEFEQDWNLAEMKGQRDIERFQAQKQYERDNPAPTDLEIYMKRANIDPSSPQGQEMFRSKAENTANPPVWRQGPDMQFYRVDTQGGAPNRPQIGATVPMPQRSGQTASSPYAPKPDVVKQAYMDLYGPERGAKMYDDLIGGR